MVKKALSWLVLMTFLCGGEAEAFEKGKKTSQGSESVRAAVLPVETKGLPKQLKKTIYISAFQELLAIGLFEMLPKKKISMRLRKLRKKRLIGPNCMAKEKCVQILGRKLRIRVIYHVAASRSPEGIRLRIRSYDGPSGKVVRDETETASSQPADMRRAVRWLVRKTSSPMITVLAAGKGKLLVECPESDAILYVNNKSLGKMTGKNLKVSSGAFDILVKKEGFKPFRDVVVVKPGKDHVVRANLEREPGPEPPLVAAVEDKKTATGKDSVRPAPPKKEVVKPPDEKREETPVEKTKKEPETPPILTGVSKEGKKQEPAPVEKKEKKMESRHLVSVREPYLPTGKEVSKPGEKDDSSDGKEKKFYQTWWFWTVTVAVVAGAGGTAAYFVLFGEEDGAGTGVVQLRWR